MVTNFGRITGRFIDADDNPLSGVVRFTPGPKRLTDYTALPDPVYIVPQAVMCTLDDEGYLIGPDGDRGVTLAATDDTDLNPVNWTYRVAILLDGAEPDGFDILVPSDTEQDLAELVPVDHSEGTIQIRGPQGASGLPGDGTTIGDLSDLSTSFKSNIVGAINEINVPLVPLTTLYNNAKAG